jgi:hypothetical protein
MPPGLTLAGVQAGALAGRYAYESIMACHEPPGRSLFV